ncbi:MAG: hypothetical protein H7Y32_06740, partial [Chloroflexales bacterium]|nr:hypothetical protein [Chloroflexales bacterium]
MSSKLIYRLSAIMLALFIGVAGVSAIGYANASQPVATPTALAVIQPTLVP